MQSSFTDELCFFFLATNEMNELCFRALKNIELSIQNVSDIHCSNKIY